MRDSFKFLDQITGTKAGHVTFVTTNWDAVPQKHQAKSEDRANELIDKDWWVFGIRGPNHCKHFKSGVSCDEDSDLDKERQRSLLVDQVLESFGGAGVNGLEMPFSEWTWGEQAKAVAQGTVLVVLSPLLVPALIVSKVFPNSDVSFGVEVSF
jgi:hypothetical protein